MCISLLHDYLHIFPFNTLISQLNTKKKTRKAHSPFNLVINMVSVSWHARWCHCEGKYEKFCLGIFLTLFGQGGPLGPPLVSPPQLSEPLSLLFETS